MGAGGEVVRVHSSPIQTRCWRYKRKGRPERRPIQLFRIHASSNDIQHIATVAQGHAAEQRKVAEDHRVRRDVASHREVFKKLRDSPDSVAGGAEQRMQRLGGVDVERGKVVGVAG